MHSTFTLSHQHGFPRPKQQPGWWHSQARPTSARTKAGRPNQQPTAAQEVMQGECCRESIVDSAPSTHTAAAHFPASAVAAGACYEDIIDALARRALTAAQQLPQHQQHVVGIAGAPGSGKSTLAQSVACSINMLCQQQGISRGAAVAPMDGFHLYKAQLDAMPDPQVCRCAGLGCCCLAAHA